MGGPQEPDVHGWFWKYRGQYSAPGDHGCRGSGCPSCGRGGSRPRDLCLESIPLAPLSTQSVQSCLPFRDDLPEIALAMCLPAGNLPWFLCCPQEKGQTPQPGIKAPHEVSLFSLAPRSLASLATLFPKCLGPFPPPGLLFRLFLLPEMPFPFFSPWKTCPPPLGTICEAGSSVNPLSHPAPNTSALAALWMVSCNPYSIPKYSPALGPDSPIDGGGSSLSPVLSTRLGDDNDN